MRCLKKLFFVVSVGMLIISSHICQAADVLGSKKEYYDKALKYAVGGNFFDARDNFKKALDIDASYREAALNLNVVTDVIHDNLNRNAALLYFEGINYTEQMFFDEAIASFDKAITIAPNYADILNSRGTACMYNGLYDLAISDFNKAINIKSDVADIYCNLGMVYALKDNYEDAVSNFNKALEIDANYIEPYVRRADVFLKIAKYDEAISDYSKALDKTIKANGEDHPSLAVLYYKRGKVLRLKGKTKEAITDLTKTIEINPMYADAYVHRGISYSTNGIDNLAVTDFNKAIEIDEKLPEAYYYRGNHYLARAQYEKAINDFTNAIERKSGYSEAYFHKAIACEMARYVGHIKDAISSYEDFISFAKDRYSRYKEYARERIVELKKGI